MAFAEYSRLVVYIVNILYIEKKRVLSIYKLHFLQVYSNHYTTTTIYRLKNESRTYRKRKGKHYFSLKSSAVKKDKTFKLYDNIDPLMEFNPPFIDVTLSREEFIYVDKATVTKKIVKKTSWNLGICARIQINMMLGTYSHVLVWIYKEDRRD
jgi:hypothetical protein